MLDNIRLMAMALQFSGEMFKRRGHLADWEEGISRKC
jgi:hypothetical protein